MQSAEKEFQNKQRGNPKQIRAGRGTLDIGAVWTGTNTSIAKYQHSNDAITGQMGRLGPLYSPYRRSRYVSASAVMEIRPTSPDVPLLLWDGYGLLYGKRILGFYCC